MIVTCGFINFNINNYLPINTLEQIQILVLRRMALTYAQALNTRNALTN